MSDWVVGLDGFKERWLGVTLVDGLFERAHVFESISAALNQEPHAAVVAIDIPIGLSAGSGRDADTAAKKFVGMRSASVFPTFPKEVYEAANHSEAARLARILTGTGVSQQSFGLRRKIDEAALAAANDPRIIEIHPEVSFRAMNSRPLAFSKKSWNGLMERRELLRRQA